MRDPGMKGSPFIIPGVGNSTTAASGGILWSSDAGFGRDGGTLGWIATSGSDGYNSRNRTEFAFEARGIVNAKQYAAAQGEEE